MDTLKEKKKFTFTASGGGARVIPSLPGAFLAFEQAEVEFDIVGGVSGGFLPGLLWRAGYRAEVVAKLAIETNFANLLNLRTSIWGLIRAELFRRVYERTLPPEGVFGTHKLGEFLQRLVPAMPEGCFTVAVAPKQTRNVPLVFCQKGVFEGQENGSYETLSDLPAPVGLVVRATSAIPGILEPIDFETNGKRMLLFDGMLTPEGRTQISPITHLFGFSRDSVIVFDVGEESDNWLTRIQDWLYRLTCRECYFPKCLAEHTEGIVVIRPHIVGIASVQFRVNEFRKLLALLSGYEATMKMLDQMGLLTVECRNLAKSILADTAALKEQTSWKSDKVRAAMMKKLLAEYGMFELNELN
jgi:predicted acylesterase/phospholipase RssA